ncbi:MAG TPA: PEGA domain-containing protein [Patescibacteria group bacterium]|nr:PEGA domain-containing protein [Patescibacteria group bacterium]
MTLNLHFRRSIMIGLITAFFLISPAVIFYTAGYRYDFATGEIKETGVLSIDILPNTATVHINEVKINGKIPLYLPNRAPGTYLIRISQPGYQSWEKDITIESKKTTYLKNISLFKDKLPVAVYQDEEKKIISLIPAPSGQYLALVSQIEKNLYEIELWDTTINKPNSLSRIISYKTPQIHWWNRGDLLAIFSYNSNQTTIELVDAADQQKSKSLTASPAPEAWQWSINPAVPELYLSQQGSIYSLSLNQKETIGKTKKTWVIAGDGILWQGEKNILESPTGGKITLDSPPQTIIDFSNQRLIYQVDNQTKIAILAEDQRVEKTESLLTTNLVYNPATTEWLAWSDWELWTLYPNHTLGLLSRGSDKINQVIPLDEHGLLLLRTDNKLIGFNPGYYTSHTLFTGEILSPVGVNQTNRKIFFLSQVGQIRGLFELEY